MDSKTEKLGNYAPYSFRELKSLFLSNTVVFPRFVLSDRERAVHCITGITASDTNIEIRLTPLVNGYGYGGDDVVNPIELLERYEFSDGSPCGIPVDEITIRAEPKIENFHLSVTANLSDEKQSHSL